MASPTDLNQYRKQRKRKKLGKRLLKLLAIVLFVLIIGVIWITREYWLTWFDGIAGKAEDIIVNDGQIDGGNFPLSFGETGEVVLMSSGETVRILTDTHINSYDSDGKKLMSYQHGYSEPILKSSIKRSIIYDLGGYSFIVISKNKIIYQQTLDDQILYASVSDEGYSAVVTKTDKYVSYLTIYDQYGDEIFNWAGGKRVVDVSFKPDSSGCYVTTISAKNGTLLSAITSLDFSKEQTLFETTMSETLIMKTKRCDNGDLWCIGDDRMFRVSSEGEILWRYDYPDTIMCYDSSAKVCAFAFEAAIKDEYTLVLQAKKQNEPFRIKFEDRIKAVKCVDDTVYVLTTKQLLTYNKNGTNLACADIENAYSDFTVIDDYVYLLGYHKIDRMEFLT